MQSKKPSIRSRAALAIFAATLLVTGTCAVAQVEKVLHNFNSKDEAIPGGLIFDGSGNLYGTTFQAGGKNNYGTVFELSPKAGGGWTERVLHNFDYNLKDGVFPVPTLIFDHAGNLYGTTEGGGRYENGIVFGLSPKAGGGWTETVLHDFNKNGTDGAYPYAGLIVDADGNLYGTTWEGGKFSPECKINGCGTVFELSPKKGGVWVETILHNFNDDGEDGIGPEAGLTLGANGDLYGTTFQGGKNGGGTVFELSPKTSGGWKETVLHNFGKGSDGRWPEASLIFDASGNIYSTTVSGGNYGFGTVFELSPKTGGGWAETILHNFTNSGNGGYTPFAALILDASGNLYGATSTGGKYGSYGSGGTVFELSPRAGGGWTEKLLHSFGKGTDGSNPYSSLTFDGHGHLYGTTVEGGKYVDGTVFEITP
jgi:uncharacterized repeat protein (TIGR03803 family)